MSWKTNRPLLSKIQSKGSLLFTTLSFLWCINLKAQQKFTDNLFVRADVHYGYLVPEYKFFNYLATDNTHSLDISLIKQTTGTTVWQQLYNYPNYGLSLFLSTLGNNDVFGRQIALYPFFNLKIVGNQKFSFNCRTGVGMCYVTKKFDLVNNYQNVAVGSKLNIFFKLELATKIQLHKKLYLTNGVAFNHYSNGNLQEPNLGVNYLTFLGGLLYSLGNNTEKTHQEIPSYTRGNEWNVIYSFGYKHARALQSKSYFTSSISAEYKRNLYYKFNLGAGADLFYDSSTKVEYEATGNKNYKNSYEYKSGIHFTEEFVYNKFSFALQEGIYLLLLDRVNNAFMYNRAIFKYKISKHFITSIAMKSHVFVLDYPELGVGYYW